MLTQTLDRGGENKEWLLPELHIVRDNECVAAAVLRCCYYQAINVRRKTDCVVSGIDEGEDSEGRRLLSFTMTHMNKYVGELRWMRQDDIDDYPSVKQEDRRLIHRIFKSHAKSLREGDWVVLQSSKLERTVESAASQS